MAMQKPSARDRRFTGFDDTIMGGVWAKSKGKSEMSSPASFRTYLDGSVTYQIQAPAQMAMEF